ncbi:UbiD-domain-containing protein [Aspergillus ellipticus CBS 707.79]|uniref:Ferulic acid decarboxylase 1 n=1 Tax=Aspergillus ellipticus CBS 707.79 TaxID=1448320 RepID=A0A319DAN8_9EURO|nr:UbiD-domain-containing protein [Aspergillus ellipticus CBS 707.79]
MEAETMLDPTENDIDDSTRGQHTLAKPETDFRAFLDALRAEGDLLDIHHEVDPHLEVCAIARRVSERNAAVPLFHNVKGARQGLWRMVSNLQSLRDSRTHRNARLAMGMGLPSTAHLKDIQYRPNVLTTGPCKENILRRDEIDLTELPVPMMHRGDGGKYLQTYGMHILQSPDGSWTNWSIARSMVHDRTKLVGLCIPPQHIWQTREMCVPPAAIIAGLPIPDAMSELDYINALTGSPLDLVKAESNDLLVPATSEIVIEGTLSVSEIAPEGPFGEYFGHTFHSARPRPGPVYDVETITLRNNTILPMSHTLASLMAPELLDTYLTTNLAILDAVSPIETYASWAVQNVDSSRLQTMATSPQELCTQIGQLLFNDKASFLTTRVLLVGDDIDIYNFRDVMWAFATRCRPVQDDYVFDEVPGLPLVPFMMETPRPCRGGKTVSSCLLPTEFRPEGRTWETVDFEGSYPPDVKDRVRSRWGEMGFAAVD